MIDRRKKDVNWTLHISDGGTVSNEHAQLAVLMDLRDELKKLNTLLHCPNVIDIPRILRGIRTKLPSKRRKKRG